MARDRATTRDAIVDTAIRLFAEQGYEAVRIEDLARASGVSRATFYNHFSEREDILGALFGRLLGDGADIEVPLDGTVPPLDAIRTVAGSAVRRMLADESLARFVYSLPVRHEALLKPDEAATPVVFCAIHRLVEAAAARGDVRDDVPVELLCTHVHGALESAMRAWAEGRTDDPAARLDVLLDLALHGVVAGDRAGGADRPRRAPVTTPGPLSSRCGEGLAVDPAGHGLGGDGLGGDRAGAHDHAGHRGVT